MTYYFTRQLAKAVNKLREGLDGLRKEQIRIARDATEADKVNRHEVVGIIASAIRSANADVPNYEKAQRDKEYSLQKKLLRATIGAGIAAAIYAAIAAYQAKLMHATLGQIQLQTGAVMKSADAAKEAADNTTRQIILDQRPWVGIIPGISTDSRSPLLNVTNVVQQPDNSVGLVVSIANTGKTPASDVEWKSFSAMVKHDTGFVTPKYTTMKYPLTGNITANFTRTNITLNAERTFTPKEMIAWHDQIFWEEMAFLVTYRDSIDATRPLHVTEVCFFIIRGNGENPPCPGKHNYQE